MRSWRRSMQSLRPGIRSSFRTTWLEPSTPPLSISPSTCQTGGVSQSSLVRIETWMSNNYLYLTFWLVLYEEVKCKNWYVHFYQFEIFAIKAAEKQNKKLCDNFHHNFKNVPCYVTSEVSLKMFYFALFDDGLTFDLLWNWRILGFCIQSLHMYSESLTIKFLPFWEEMMHHTVPRGTIDMWGTLLPRWVVPSFVS